MKQFVFSSLIIIIIGLTACEKSSENRIMGFEFTDLGVVAQIKEKDIIATVPYETDVTALVPTIVISPDATVSPKSGAPQNFSSPIVYTVTAQDGSVAEYTVTVTITKKQYLNTFETLNIASNSCWRGPDMSVVPVEVNLWGYLCTVYYGSFSEGNASFSNVFNNTWSSWSGFAYSNRTDKTTSDYTNECSVYDNGGSEGSANFVVAYAPAGTNPPATITFAEPQVMQSVQIQNSTYTALSIINGDDFAEPFGEGDYLKLTFKGYYNNELTNSNTVTLASYNNSKLTLLDMWTSIDLSSLGTVTKIECELTCSNPNTPSYFCLDNLQGVSP